MNERVQNLVTQAFDSAEYLADQEYRIEPNSAFCKKFAELIVRECMRVALDEIVSDEDIDNTMLIEDRCYLQGNNGGVVDAVVAIKQHFGVE